MNKFPVPNIPLLGRRGDPYCDAYNTYIAGVNFRCDELDEGGFTGYIVPDTLNETDDKAMAVCSFKKQLGYIPAKELKEFREWCGGRPVPCAGYITIDDDTGKLRGRVKAILPCNVDFVQTEFNRYIQWLNDTHGEEFVPENLTICVDAGDEEPSKNLPADVDDEDDKTSCNGCMWAIIAVFAVLPYVFL